MTSSQVPAILTEGFAALVAAGPGAGIDWSAKTMPPSPDRHLTYTVYRTMRHPVTRLDGYALQVRGRGVPDDDLDVDELLDPVIDFLCELEHVDLTVGDVTVHVDQVLFRSSAPLGVDEQSRRAERADTLDLHITPPPTARRQV